MNALTMAERTSKAQRFGIPCRAVTPRRNRSTAPRQRRDVAGRQRSVQTTSQGRLREAAAGSSNKPTHIKSTIDNDLSLRPPRILQSNCNDAIARRIHCPHPSTVCRGGDAAAIRCRLAYGAKSNSPSRDQTGARGQDAAFWLGSMSPFEQLIKNSKGNLVKCSGPAPAERKQQHGQRRT